MLLHKLSDKPSFGSTLSPVRPSPPEISASKPSATCWPASLELGHGLINVTGRFIFKEEYRCE